MEAARLEFHKHLQNKSYVELRKPSSTLVISTNIKGEKLLRLCCILSEDTRVD
jgi:hypothetical protein